MDYDGTQTFSITTEPCYNIQDILVDGNSIGVQANYIFTHVVAPHTISASFVSTGSLTQETVAACAKYKWKGTTYTQSGDYTYNLGCNTATLHLTITPKTTYYQDLDGDGYGNTTEKLNVCTQPRGYVTNRGDCDDNDNTVYPGAPELCDGKDNDCNGKVDEKCASISINDVALVEGNSGSKTMNFTILLSPASLERVTVNFSTENATATAADYIAVSGIVVFAPGVRKQTIQVIINGDKTAEPDEIFSVNLSGAVNATIGDGVGVGTIINDDGKTTLQAKQINNTGQPSIVISPVPASNKITVQLNGFTGYVTLQLLNIQGEILRQEKLQTGISKLTLKEINVADIATGTYFITVFDEKGKRQTKSLLVER